MNKKLFIDLGAHEGDSIEKFYNQVPDADKYDIISFEANPTAFNKLCHNVEQAGYRNVTTVNMAVGIHTGMTNLFLTELYEGRGNTTLHGKITSKVDYDNPIEIRCIDFCEWFKTTKRYDHIILKMNIEGSEYPILREMLKRKMIGMIDHYCVYFHQSRFDESRSVVSAIIEEAFIREVKRLEIPTYINHHTFNRDDRLEIVWVCEFPGWAYDKIATELSSKLPKFRHTKIYLNLSKGYRGARSIGRMADLIVCFYPPYMQFFDNKNKTILRLDGNRAFEIYEKNPKHRKLKIVELESVDVGDAKASSNQI